MNEQLKELEAKLINLLFDAAKKLTVSVGVDVDNKRELERLQDAVKILHQIKSITQAQQG